MKWAPRLLNLSLSKDSKWQKICLEILDLVFKKLNWQLGLIAFRISIGFLKRRNTFLLRLLKKVPSDSFCLKNLNYRQQSVFAANL
jgi:hypothetical protein